jgi:lipoate-protein ligase A
LRADDRNFCIINQGSPRAIVMGISGDMERLLDVPLVKKDNIPVIRRFSGGGTVIVDENTLFITFIFSKNGVDVAPFPEPILRWTSELYQAAWAIPGFTLLENDYIIDEKKCGGNAQYIKKDRWLHHTSFLWDYKDANMTYLQLPAKRPKYRQDRGHQEFLCRIKDLSFGTLSGLKQKFLEELVKRFYIQHVEPYELQIVPHRQTVSFL